MAKDSISPMLRQYLELKDKYKDTLLFFRLGDFYEMFFEDAKLASEELELTLTGRSCGLEERAPMCGVPYHAIDQYVNRLLEKGYKVAICEQLTEPGQGKMLERDVVRIITPGTVIETSILDERANNYLAAICFNSEKPALAYADVSTGEFCVTEFAQNAIAELSGELSRLDPKEILADPAAYKALEGDERLSKAYLHSASVYNDESFSPGAAEELKQLDGYDAVKTHQSALDAASGIYAYLKSTQKITLIQISQIRFYRVNEYMLIDNAARRSLELTQTMRAQNRRGTLLWVIDKANTAMGSRTLRAWLDAPLQDADEIYARQDMVEELVKNPLLLSSLREALKNIKDMERLTAKIAYASLNARDCFALGESAAQIPKLKKILLSMQSDKAHDIGEGMDALEDICCLLQRAMEAEAPLSLREGGIIKRGYNAELDRLRDSFTDSRSVITAMEAREREATGIKNLRIGFNKGFGYYIEITNSAKDLVPYTYIRKQTLANAERYITPQLKELEDAVLHAEERSMRLEYELFLRIRDKLAEAFTRLQRTAKLVAQADALWSLACVAVDNSYVRPEVDDSDKIQIIDGRHPMVERSMQGEFVPNNTLLDNAANRFLIITGPNMAGKSTYLRQVALIVILAHIGSFVPATSAHIGIVDRVFTRVGAADDLFMGQSTFMVEMSEMAEILRCASSRSLIVLDEIGRGTSTFDGLSIAWAVVEYICGKETLGAKTLFATHYHELTELEDKLAGIKNYYIAAKEMGDEIVFLRKIVRGGADKSFGVQVAKLAGMPKSIIRRSREILRELEENDVNKAGIKKNMEKAAKLSKHEETSQVSFVDALPYADTLEEIRVTDINALTPMDAMFLLNKLKSKM